MSESIEKELIDSINKQFVLVYCMLSYIFVSINVYLALTYYYNKN